MQALQRILDNIVAQMKGLPPTARLLIGSLMAIVVLSLFLVAQLTGQPSMMPLPVTLADEGARARVIAYLDSAGIPHEQRGSELRDEKKRQHHNHHQRPDQKPRRRRQPFHLGDNVVYDPL